MQLYSSLEDAKTDGVWLTIGSFDGVHRGHQAIMHQLVAGAHMNMAPAVVLTFFPHPTVVLRGGNGPFYLTSPDERAALLGELGADIVIVQRFDRHLAATKAKDFVTRLRQHLGFRHLLVGKDFTLGRGREGDINTLTLLGKELGYEVEIHPPVEINGQVISSSKIRANLLKGDIEHANEMLGRPYHIIGSVIPGDSRGRTIGYPTANLNTWSNQLLPATGVYASRVCLEGNMFSAATNIGVRPTFDGASFRVWVETHILDFQGDLYGRQIQLEFISRLRNETKFSSVQALTQQIKMDISNTRRIITKLGLE